MTISTEEAISLGLYFVLMLAIGLYAYRRSTSDLNGYMLGGRQLHPAVGALSAGASDMSGWLMMGLPGAVYVSGVSAAWIAVGLVIGAYYNYRLVAPRLRVYTEQAGDAITIPDFLEQRLKDNSHALRLFSALVIVVFFTLYTSAGMVAGGKLFESAFGLDYTIGLVVTAGVVLAYTVTGGFLAVSLTDFVQGVIMFLALLIVPVVALLAAGGPGALGANVAAAPNVEAASYFSWTEGVTLLGLISLMAWGLGYFGQPHIIVRFMAIRSLRDVHVARWIGMGWMMAAVIGAVLVGLFGLAFVQATGAQDALQDPETIFILLSQTLFPPLVSGVLLAAILAAIMSTISSQLLVSSSSVTEDVYRTFFRREASERELVLMGRVSVLVVAVVAMALALDRSSSVLSLVGNAWAGFGAAFGPVILLSLFWRGLTRNGALAGMIVGALTVLIWIYAPVSFGGQGLSQWMYEIVPGFAFALLAAVSVSLVSRQADAEILDGFDEMESSVQVEPTGWL